MKRYAGVPQTLAGLGFLGAMCSFGTACAGGGDEELGEALQELTFPFNTVRVYPAEPISINATGVKAAWIRRNDDTSENLGRGLLAWTRWSGTSTPRAAYGHSDTWLNQPPGGAPTYSVGRSDDPDPALKWRTPLNLCQVFPLAAECGGPNAAWSATGRYSHVHAALWTGLDELAAIVTSCGVASDDQAVCIVVSPNGGQSFTVPFLLSIPAHDGTITSGDIDPSSVQATLASFGERQNGNIGELSLPIYVSWRRFDQTSGAKTWFFTRVLVGATGDIAESTLPRELPMPAETGVAAGNHATVFGYHNGQRERIAVAYSDRDDKNNPPNCESGAGSPTNVSWYATQSDDFGLSWGCFTGINSSACLPNSSAFPPNSQSARTLITSSSGWRPCVGGAMFNSAGTFAKNNDRPEVVMHAPALSNADSDSTLAQMFFFAVNKKHPSQNRQRIEVFRTGALDVVGSSTQNIIKSVWAENTSGLMDAWGQSLSVISRNGTVPDEIAGITVAYRTADSTTGGLRVRTQQWRESIPNSFLNPINQEVTGTPLAGQALPSAFESRIGLQVGVANLQACGTGFDQCPDLTTVPARPFWGVLVGWEDSRETARRNNDVYARAGKYQ